ncbi:MAG: hypothetical protein ACLQU4_04450, partial [Limisphaerales bacterium]
GRVSQLLPSSFRPQADASTGERINRSRLVNRGIAVGNNLMAHYPGIGTNAFALCGNLAGVYFEGNFPRGVDYFAFTSDNNVIAYYLPGTTGWGSSISEHPSVTTLLWNPLIQASGTNFGVQSGQFGFNITGTNNFTVLVEACTNLASPVWIPIQTLTLANGSAYFIDQEWTNYPARYYALGLP